MTKEEFLIMIDQPMFFEFEEDDNDDDDADCLCD